MAKMISGELLIACLAVMAVLNAVVVTGNAPQRKEDSLPEVPTHQSQREFHREKRQSNRNPNILVLLFQLIGETRRDIQKTFNDIAREVQNGIVDENTIANATTSSSSAAAAATSAEAAEAETTTERVRVSRQELTRILSRNWRGLTRLFNQEVEIAVDQSNKSATEARKAFVESLAPFLAPATSTARSTTTARSG